jgi:hypothetical protein
MRTLKRFAVRRSLKAPVFIPPDYIHPIPFRTSTLETPRTQTTERTPEPEPTSTLCQPKDNMTSPCGSPDHFVISNGMECIGYSAHNQGQSKDDDQPFPSSPSPPSTPSASTTSEDLTLYGADINLSHLSKQEGAFILTTASSVLRDVSFILSTFASTNTTRSTFSSAYKSLNPAESWVLRAVVASYVAIFENLANILSPSFSDRDGVVLRTRFQHMWSWMSDCANLGEAASSMKREWRNSCAHRAFIEKPFEHQCSSELRARPFKAGVFFDVLSEWMPPLHVELQDLVAVLQRDGDSLVAKDYSDNVVDSAETGYSVEAQQRDEDRAKTLIEEGDEEVKALQDAEDAAKDALRTTLALTALITKRFEDKAIQRKDEKLSRVAEIWKVGVLASATPAPEWEDINNRGWDAGDANVVVGDEVSSDSGSGINRTEEEIDPDSVKDRTEEETGTESDPAQLSAPWSYEESS